MLGMRRLAAAALFLALAGLAVAAQPDDDDGLVWADGVPHVTGQASPDAPQAEPAEPSGEVAWRLCRVKMTLLLTAGGRSQVVHEEERALFHGEVMELEGDAQGDAGSRAVLFKWQVRLRAAVARPDGVLYQLTTSVRLASTVGFSSDLVGQDIVRHAFPEISDRSAILHELFAMPDPPMRLVLAMTAEPIGGRVEPMTRSLAVPRFEDRERFAVEVVLREGDSDKLMDRVEIQTTPGKPAKYAFARLDARRKDAGDPERRLGEGVRVRDLGHLDDSGYGDTHVVHGRRIEPSWDPRDAESADSGYLATHEVPIDGDDDPAHFTMKVKSRKLSKRKQAKLREQQEILAAARAAQDRARNLPASEAVPEGFEREQLAIEITPLHAGEQFLQAEVRVHGALRLPGEREETPVDLDFVEQLERGEPFELALVELLRGPGSSYDYVFRITPSP